jgi:uncharacterized protein (UPF0548 family)
MRVFAYGTLQTVPNRTWERVLRQFGGQRAKTARGADLIVIGAGAASRPTAAIGDDLSRFRDSRQAVQSERVFLRSIGLLPRAARRTALLLRRGPRGARQTPGRTNQAPRPL